LGSSQSCTLDDAGHPWVDQDDHGENRRTRWRRRRRARQIAYRADPAKQSESTHPLRRLKTCGLAKKPDVEIRINNGHGFATGLFACGNIWTCPTCSARIRARRETEIETALATHVANGGSIGMMTLTLQHNASMPLTYTMDAINHAWHRLYSARKYKHMARLLTGTIATLEITTGSGNAGWHPHLHIIMLTEPGTTQLEWSTAGNKLRQRWSDLVNKRTTVYSLERGLNLHWFGSDSATAAKYVTKLAKEITLTDTKSGNDPFSLLDHSEHPELDDLHEQMFLEYAAATRGRQCHRWSAGLHALLGLGEGLLTDEELAERNEEPSTPWSLPIPREQWNKLTDDQRLGFIELAEAIHLLSSA
jgi:hypothetical protein